MHSGTGACDFLTGTPVDLTASSPTYIVAMNDFMAAGGDGYNNAPPAGIALLIYIQWSTNGGSCPQLYWIELTHRPDQSGSRYVHG